MYTKRLWYKHVHTNADPQQASSHVTAAAVTVRVRTCVRPRIRQLPQSLVGRGIRSRLMRREAV